MNKPELLSPVGDFECLKSAIQNGADAVYLGASSFNARAKAENFNDEKLLEAIQYAKLRNVKVHLALNTLIKNNEFEEAVNLAVNAYNMGIDAIIIQDLGLASYLSENYPEIPLHASTQMTVHNLDGVKQLEKLGFSRVVLARELSIDEIKYIRKNTNIELEIFIHGALCISYSGQCLLSSMIGGRSGNRGLCAQPCRLPYELYEEKNDNTFLLEKGYLLSPRDNFGIEFLPELIKMGINSFKIEGRMKTPTYVGLITNKYKKYINLVSENLELDNQTIKNIINKNLNIINKETNLSDKEEITQVFNRGGFSTGHFKPSPNKELIFKEKPNNMGIYIGTISHINENKGHLKLKLENTLSIGDRISINNNSYIISELMIDNNNYETLEKGSIVKIGRMKGNISVGSKIYRIESTSLNKYIFSTFKEEKNFKKVKLNGKIIVKENQPISLKIWSNDGFYKNLEFISTSSIPQKALTKPIFDEKIIEQISKTGNTEFEFNNIDVILDDNLFIQMSVLNDLRRTALEGLEKLVLQKYSHNLKINNNLPKTINTTLKSSENNFLNSNKNFIENKNLEEKKPISLLLNILKNDYNYCDLEGIDNLYIPLNYFINPQYKNLLEMLTNKFSTYIYMQHIVKDKKINSINFYKIISDFNIKGFVISHISQLEKVKKFNLKLIGNFNLNVYNNFSIKELHKLGLDKITISPELDKFDLNNVSKNSILQTETIVYGNLPVMTTNYCYLGKTNRCFDGCEQKCKKNSIFYLKDRMNFNFRIIPDNSSTISTIYNSKTLSVTYNDIYTNSIRIDIIDENIAEIQEIISTVKSGNRFEGKKYTNGKF